MKTVSIATLGCKSNQYDSSAIEEAVRKAGFAVLPFPGVAGAYVINTCTVTARTDARSRGLVRMALKLNPDALVIVTGCFAEVSPDEAVSIEGVAYCLGNPQKDRVVDYLRMGRPSGGAGKAVGGPKGGAPLTIRSSGPVDRVRANLKIQEGCNRACSYCIIPRARGASKSLPPEEVLAGISGLADAGFGEVILTGIHIGGYGGDIGDAASLPSLLREIESRRPPCRVRLSSLDPDEVTDEVIGILGGARVICNHAHIALQSGDDAVLAGMRRPYTASSAAGRIRRLAEAVPDISIGVDVIAGFPGETEEGFENTLALLAASPAAYLHVFPYSRRRGTAAAGYDGQIKPGLMKARCARLAAVGAAKRKAFLERFIGRTASVLVEKTRDRRGFLTGRTRNYSRVRFPGGDDMIGKEAHVRLVGCEDNGMTGEVIGAE